ncbi:MAG: IclR family transcriptional regulator [Kiritimatiellia bacterium]|nr:IclR family transcriptional regulator [Kiritimatiellia bacterium]
MKKEPIIQSVCKALKLLDCLAEKGAPVQLRDLARGSGLSSPTAHHLLKTLVLYGYVARAPGRQYQLGLRALALGTPGDRFEGLIRAATPFLETLAKEHGETVVLTVLKNHQRHRVMYATAHHAVRVSADIEKHGQMFDRVTGRVLTAFSDPDVRSEILRVHGFPGVAWRGIATVSAFEKACARLRAEGYAMERTEQGLDALAVPILNSEGRLCAAIGLYQPSFRSTAAFRQKLVAALKAAALEIGSRLSIQFDARPVKTEVNA